MHFKALIFSSLLLVFASITSHIHNWVLFLLSLQPFILSEVISLLIGNILGTYPPGEFLYQYLIILPFHTVHGVQGKNTEVVCHSLLQWTTFCQTFPSWKTTESSLHFQGKPFNITIIQAYAPTSNAEEAEWFYEELQDLLELTPKKDVLFIIGDWNAKVGSQETPGVTGKFGLGVRNEGANRVLPRERTGHSKHPLPTTQEKTLHMDITRWSTPKSY